MMRLDPVSRMYEVLLVSDMKLNRARRNFAPGKALSEVTGLEMLSRELILSLVLGIAVLTYLH